MLTRKKIFLGILIATILGIVAIWLHDKDSARAVAITPSLTNQLTSNKAAVEVTGLPTGTTKVHVAYMKDLNAAGLHYTDISTTAEPYKGTTEYPVIDEQAFNAEGKAIGSWAGRKTTIPGGEVTKTETTPTPPPPSTMKVGLDSGGWWLTNDSAMNAGKLKLERSQNRTNEELSKYENSGWKQIDLIGHNPATNVNAESLASEAVTRAKAHPSVVATEILNEPQNPYLGGSESQSNIEAYARIVNTVANKFASAGLTTIPKLLWSCDGGFRGVSSWGAKVWPLLNANVRQYGRPTVHPYGGTGNREQSALGGRNRVEESYKLTNEKSWITEVGWPTAVGQAPTGDSLQWTQAEQAKNIEVFVKWAPPYAEEVTIFQYRDYSPNNFYGIETKEGAHKISFNVLQGLS